MAYRRNPFTEARRERKLELLKYIANPNPLVVKNKGIPLRRLVGAFSTRWGISAKIIYDYIDELRDAGLIRVTAGFVTLAVPEEVLDELFGSRKEWKTTEK